MKLVIVIVGAALGLVSSLTTAQEWVDVKSPEELRALYSNKTFRGKDYLDRPFVSHYRADGEGVMISATGRVPRSWTVKGNDQVCVKLPWDSPCFRIQRHASKPATFRSINVANDVKTEFTVEDGVPKF